ncbi:MAG: zinc ribbon domain-containing protein [Bryobacterales bacterium]|nr:zinc ribbon domain-containing protein [Bryobacterales bacterium]
MPIYEYKCSECGNVYEKRQKFSDPSDTTCNCEKKAPVFRVTSAPALVFKGSGWYINDYARAGKDGGKNGSPKENDASKETGAPKETGASSGKGVSTDSGSSAKGDSGAAASPSSTASSPAPASPAKS